MENTGQGASEIHAAIKELVDRDGTTQAAYSLLNMALKKINDDKGMFWIPKSELTKNLLASIEQLLNQKRYDEAYLISHSHAKRIKKDFDEAKKDALNFDKFIASINYDDKGNFKSESLISAIMKLKHFDKYVQSAARQAVNAERLRVKKKKNGGGGLARDISVPVEKSEFQKQMDFALS